MKIALYITVISFFLFSYMGLICEFIHPWAISKPMHIGIPVLMTSIVLPVAIFIGAMENSRKK